jgi:uncharacterized membrane protein YeaQ/YmgE (transglycosylase-associated protein family)
MFFVVFFTWLGVGLAVGFGATKVINLRGDDPKLGIIAAVVGAVVGGILFAYLAGVSSMVWTWWWPVAALVGALVAAALWHGIRSRFISHERPTFRRSY